MTTDTSRRAVAMAEGRRADSDRHRQRVLAAIADARADGVAVTVSGIARRAGVDRTFLYRHRDLLDQLHDLATQLPDTRTALAGAVTRASLQTDLHAAQKRCVAFAARVQQLERRLSELMGEQTWQASGLGAPDDIDQLHRRIASLAAEAADVRIQLEERTDELNAARLANRELMTHLNSSRPPG
jgi:chromosome segregation ATPase